MDNFKTGLLILVGTRKGAFFLHADAQRKKWRVDGPHCFGQVINHVVFAPDSKTLLIAAKAGHLGHTIFRSTDLGKTWVESTSPPAFAKSTVDPRTVNHVFWLTPGHVSEPGIWYAGTSPQGLFRSEDDGVTWKGVDGFNSHPDRRKWTGPDNESPPDGATLHSINVNPFDVNHLYIGMSAGGVFESYDRGKSWRALNQGCAADSIPTPDPEYGHDPHCLRVHPAVNDVVYQQNHCGIYRLERTQNRWTRIGLNMPSEIGDIGFPLVLHPRDPKTLWVFPMDGTSVWPRTAINGKPAVYRSTDAGESWQRQDKGLPAMQAWHTVKRQAMSADQHRKVGLYFGTTSGEVWASFDEGETWQCLMLHLPHIYSVEAYTL